MKHSTSRTTRRVLAAVGAGACPIAALAAGPFIQIDQFDGPASSSEIVAFDASRKLLFSTYGAPGNGGIQVIDASNPANLSEVGLVDMSTIAGQTVKSVSSVAADPLGRGFAVATFIPQDSGSRPGQVVFFDPATLAVLKSVEVGFHPDSVRFSADGTRIHVVNEGEPVSETAGGVQHFDRPGSISIIDVAGVSSTAELPSLGAGQVATYDFSAAHLATGVSLDGVRVHPSNNPAITPGADRANDLEPEAVTEVDGKLYVTLQENNAVAEFDLATRQWTRVGSLGTIAQTIDASDRDGAGNSASIKIDDVVKGMPMPDGIAGRSASGRNFLFTANEGDGRPPDFVLAGHPLELRDDPRVSELSLDPAYKAGLDLLYGGANSTANSRLGRLRVDRYGGDTDGDGDIDELRMFGTRSFSIWDADTGDLVWDSGSFFESHTALELPSLFNSEGTAGSFDGRSPNKGPEPEGIALGEIGDQTWAFIGLERIGGVMIFDVTHPENPFFVQYLNTGERAPEGLEFVSANQSPTGLPLLFVGYEVSSQVGVYSLVPETGHRLPIGIGLAAGLLVLRRRGRTV